MSDYKTGINTQLERETLKRLIATIHAKRNYNKVAPGARLIKDMMRAIERNGVLDNDLQSPPEDES